MDRIEAMHEARANAYGEHWTPILRYLVIDTIDNKWKDHLHAMEVLKNGIGLRGYAQVDPKNEYKKEGFEKFQQLKHEIADHVIGFAYKQEATDTIRDMLTGRLRQQAPAPTQPRMPTQEELQALFQQLLAAGRIPPQVLDRMGRGAQFQMRISPDGQQIQLVEVAPPPGDDGAAAAGAPPGDGAGGPAPAAADPAAAGQATPTAVPPAPPAPPPTAAPTMPQAPGGRRLAPAMPMAPTMPARPPAPKTLPPGAAKPGRNDLCPCGSGIKYKKCCAPAFD
jgi:preprotein translocase subunit SecA